MGPNYQLKQLNIPEVVQLRARQYLEYTYDKHRWRTNKELYTTLSSTLARRIYAFSDRDVLRKAFLFTDSSEQFLNALVTHMTRLTLQHHDHIVSQVRSE